MDEEEKAAAFTGEIIPSAKLTRIKREVPSDEEVDKDNVTGCQKCDKNDYSLNQGPMSRQWK